MMTRRFKSIIIAVSVAPLCSCEDAAQSSQVDGVLYCETNCSGGTILLDWQNERIMVGDTVLSVASCTTPEFYCWDGFIPLSYPKSGSEDRAWRVNELSYKMSKASVETNACPEASKSETFLIEVADDQKSTRLLFSYQFGVIRADIQFCLDEYCETKSRPEVYAACTPKNFMFE